MDETLFGWVHLSDIHFGHGGKGYAPNQKLVLAEVQSDIAAHRGRVAVDAVLVTGDIAFSGGGLDKNEYVQAREWLLATGNVAGVDQGSIFLVPGNHDVDRGADRDLSVGPLVEALRDGKRSLDETLASQQGREILARRMARYLELARQFGRWAGEASPPPAEDQLWWKCTRTGRGGLKVRLAGLNTSLLSRDRDEGKLFLGETQLAAVLQPSADAGELIVVLSHHPFRTGWLADEKNADRWVRNHAHVHLSGHVHEAETEFAGSGGGNTFVRVVAGAAHAERNPETWSPARHGYSFGEVRRRGDGLVLRVYPRLWSDQKKTFVVDPDGVPDGATWAEHPLRVTLPATQGKLVAVPVDVAVAPQTTAPPLKATGTEHARPSPRLPEKGPVRVFLSYAPEDEALKRELDKHLSVMKRTRVIEISSSRAGGEVARGDVDPLLQSAHIVLLLFTQGYLASDYCFEVEMEAARVRYEAGEVELCVVLLEEVDLYYERAHFKLRWSGERTAAWFENLTRLPHAKGHDDNNKLVGEREQGIPVSTWQNKDAAWKEIADEIRDEIAKLRRKQG